MYQATGDERFLRVAQDIRRIVADAAFGPGVTAFDKQASHK